VCTRSIGTTTAPWACPSAKVHPSTMEVVSHHRTLNPQLCRSWVPCLFPRPDRWSYGVGATEVPWLYTTDVWEDGVSEADVRDPVG
jgi:hypothetical protein